MKKLMTILSAAALATGAFAETATVTTGTETFEGFAAGVNITTNTPTPTTDGEYLWYSAGDADEGETGTVTAYAADDAKPANGADSNANYLNVSTTTGTPLYRTVSSHSGTITSADANPVDIGTGIFVDTYVQFSGSETAPQIPDGSKLVVWVQAIDYDDNGTTDNTADDIQGSTNLVVTSAMLDVNGVPTATNFVIETAADFDFEGWHRLTIRAIKDITSGTELAGFTVFVDGAQLAAKEVQIAGSAAVTDEEDNVTTETVPAVTYNDLMGAYPYADNLTAEAKAFYNNCQLFVSLVGSNTYYGEASKTLSAVGFDGTGKIDDVTVSDDRSQFAFARGDFYFTMEWDAGITGFTLTANDAEEGAFTQTYTKTGAGSEVIVIPAAASQVTISAITTASGSTYEGEAEVVVDLLAATSYSLVTKTTLAEVDGTTYTSFADALAAAKSSGKVLTLMADVTIAETISLTGTDKLYLDLNGKTITFNGTDLDGDLSMPVCFVVNSETAELKIISSEQEGEFAIGEDAFAAGYGMAILLKENAGTVELGNTTTDAGVVYPGSITIMGGTCLVYKGKFDAMLNGAASAFGLASYLATGATATDITINEVAFVEVTPQASEPEVTFYTLSVPVSDYAAFEIITNGVSCGENGGSSSVSVPADTEYVVVYQPLTPYTYAGVDLTDTGWTYDADSDTIKLTGTVVDADVTITDVPVPVATFDVEVTANANATYTSNPETLTGLAAGTPVTITATAAEGFTYTGVTAEGWTVAEGGATATYTVTVNEAMTVVIPAPDAITIQISVSCTNCTCTADAADLNNVAYGSTVKFTATPNTGYTFDGAELNGWTLVDGNATYTLEDITADAVVAPPMAQLIVPVPGAEAPQYESLDEANAAAAKMDVSAADKALGIDKSYFKPTVTGSDAEGWTVTTELDAEVVQPSTETAVKAIPEAIADAAEGAEITVNIPGVKAGLQYVVEVVTELGNLGNAENLEGKTWTRAGTDGNLELPVTKPTGGKGFFKVHVKHR